MLIDNNLTYNLSAIKGVWPLKSFTELSVMMWCGPLGPIIRILTTWSYHRNKNAKTDYMQEKTQKSLVVNEVYSVNMSREAETN